MADASQQLIEALETLDEVADGFTPDTAAAELDETSLQVFWRDWPRVSAWAGALWRNLNTDLAEQAGAEGVSSADTGGGG